MKRILLVLLGLSITQVSMADKFSGRLHLASLDDSYSLSVTNKKIIDKQTLKRNLSDSMRLLTWDERKLESDLIKIKKPNKSVPRVGEKR